MQSYTFDQLDERAKMAAFLKYGGSFAFMPAIRRFLDSRDSRKEGYYRAAARVEFGRMMLENTWRFTIHGERVA